MQDNEVLRRTHWPWELVSSPCLLCELSVLSSGLDFITLSLAPDTSMQWAAVTGASATDNAHQTPLHPPEEYGHSVRDTAGRFAGLWSNHRESMGAIVLSLPPDTKCPSSVQALSAGPTPSSSGDPKVSEQCCHPALTSILPRSLSCPPHRRQSVGRV
jgi:hypothetical protein